MNSTGKSRQKVVKIYALRMRIEEAFRDLKSTRFGLSLELHRSYQPQRLQVLLLVATLALLMAWRAKPPSSPSSIAITQANTVRHRVVLSTIFIGLKVINNDPRLTLRLADLLTAIRSLQ